MNLVWKNSGRKPKELEELVELPESFREIWHWFIELNNARSSNGFGMNALSYTEILSYFTLKGIQPTDEEVSIIKSFDNIAMEYFSKEASKKTSKK